MFSLLPPKNKARRARRARRKIKKIQYNIRANVTIIIEIKEKEFYQAQ